MPIKDVQVPDIGNFDEVAVVEVLVKPGDQVAAEAPLVSLESDKATMDVPAPFAGTVREVRVAAGAKVGKGAVILTMEVADEAAPGASAAPAPAAAGATPPPVAAADGAAKSPEEPAAAGAAPTPRETPPASGPPAAAASAPPTARPAAPPPIAAGDEPGFAKAYATPAIRRFARELGVPLGRVTGTGRNGRITREDVQGFVKRTLAQWAGAAGAAGGAFGLPEMPRIDFAKFGAITERPLSRIQRLGGQHVHRAWLHVPHVTQHDEADITDMEAFRKEQAEDAAARGFKLTPLAFIMKACVLALRQHPELNSSLGEGGETLIVKQYYHLGIAVDTPEGLVVPVVRDVDRKGIFDLARELAEVSARARDKKLRPDDLQGGTFTISSLGGIGGTGFTPIVNAPEVAILGVSRAAMRPVYRHGDEGEDGVFVPRLMLPLSLSYDHRVIDGAAAARFTTTLAGALSDLRKMLL